MGSVLKFQRQPLTVLDIEYGVSQSLNGGSVSLIRSKYTAHDIKSKNTRSITDMYVVSFVDDFKQLGNI